MGVQRTCLGPVTSLKWGCSAIPEAGGVPALLHSIGRRKHAAPACSATARPHCEALSVEYVPYYDTRPTSYLITEISMPRV